VLLAQNLGEKLRRGALFRIDQPFLAGAGIDQQADGQGQVGLAREILDGLFLAVFVYLEVALLQVADQRAVLSADTRQQTDQVYVHPDGLIVLSWEQGCEGQQHGKVLHTYNVRCLRSTLSSMRKAINHLKKADPVMAAIIKKAGPYQIRFHEPEFQMLVRSIVNQQLSGKAAHTIFTRLKAAAKADPLTPASILKLRLPKLRSAGLS